MGLSATNQKCRPSLPTRERGLKLFGQHIQHHPHGSLPTRERGLKSAPLADLFFWDAVAPYTGAWIEILDGFSIAPRHARRSLHGSVD